MPAKLRENEKTRFDVLFLNEKEAKESNVVNCVTLFMEKFIE